MQLAQEVGRVGALAREARDAALRVEARFNESDQPERLTKLEGRVGALEQNDRERVSDRRFFWTGLVALVAAAATAVRALWPHVGGG